jgi:hypothetical protein
MNLRAKPYMRSVFCLLVALGGLMVMALTMTAGPGDACAAAGGGSAPTTPCDPEYMDALEARAWLEAQREISQNQNLIVKPDSVLEYTCFDRFLSVLAEQASQMFSETTRWGNIPGLDERSMDTALQSLIFAGLRGYIEQNFGHTYLGGRSANDYTMPGSLSGGNYTCDQMKTVWNDAKCLNFFDEPTYDGFYDFYWYQTNDPRQQPTSGGFTACQPPDDTTYKYDNMQNIAFNGKQTSYVLNPENPNDATAYKVDTLVTFLNFILPKGVAPATNCQPAIATGITVNRRLIAAYEDAVCPNPGCYYQRSGGGLGQCQ